MVLSIKWKVGGYAAITPVSSLVSDILVQTFALYRSVRLYRRVRLIQSIDRAFLAPPFLLLFKQSVIEMAIAKQPALPEEPEVINCVKFYFNNLFHCFLFLAS